MSRTSFFNRSSLDNSPLLPQNKDDLSLQDLSPRPSQRSHSSAASPSPPPSFYRLDDSKTTSPSRAKPRKIQFAAPPPPIASSVFLLPGRHGQEQVGSSKSPSLSPSIRVRTGSPNIRKGSGGIDPLIGLERREKSIQKELQLLLDAQSAGLLQGFGGDSGDVREGGAVGRDGSSDAGSTTPTSRSVQRSSSRNGDHGGIVPVRQPKRKVVGLKAARKGLLRDMAELVEIKTEEEGILNGHIQKREDILRQVKMWEERIEGFRDQLNGYLRSGGRDTGHRDGSEDGGGEESAEIAELRTEERAVENEIREMEDRLAQMKARKKWLGERIQLGVNKQEARLSSYRGALREVESEVKMFLKRPPVPVSVVMGDEEGLMALPAGRRTLGIAQEWWNKEISQLQLRKKEVEVERSALEDGAKMWEECASKIMGFEEELRKEMAVDKVQDAQMLRDQIGKMEKVIGNLEENTRRAEENGWNLLICALGAELEAFREGEVILKGALKMFEEQDRGPKPNGENNYGARTEDDVLGGLNREQSTSNSVEREEREESEDDGPNLAELLVDHGAADGDDTSG